MTLSRPLPEPLVDLAARRFRVMGQPVRIHLIERLDRLGESHVQALADELGETQQNTSKHLGTLWRAGMVTRRQEGRVTVYSMINAETFAVVERVAIAIAIELRDSSSARPSGQEGA